MATNDEYLQLRRMTGEVGSSTYTDADLDIFITTSGDLNAAAAAIWAEKAAAYADLVNISEAGSSRSNSDLFKHAADQRDHFAAVAAATVAVSTGSTTTRPIQRA